MTLMEKLYHTLEFLLSEDIDWNGIFMKNASLSVEKFPISLDKDVNIQ